MLSSCAIREKFIKYFEAKQHTYVKSSPLVPHNDKTLLFTNAGMVPFKDVFLGVEKRDYSKACSSQKCVRAGGKHNDLENVGYTARHHTFFEMLGNFSFGDYFKKEAITFAWSFLTKELKIPATKLWITVFEEDSEAEDIWLNDLKVDPARFSKIGAKDNFWSMGEIGPCGPCTEIFYDHGSDIAGGPPGTPDEDGDRYIEIWNLVFMQYNRDKAGKLTPLPKPSVDTGMGLERIAAVMQGVHDNYETDTFQYLIKAIAKNLAVENLDNKSLRVIADHIRAICFLILDGVLPSNEGRGYVLRRIMRRAVRHGYQLGAKNDFLNKLVKPLADIMGLAYPELNTQHDKLVAVIKQEEQQFAKTLTQGMKLLDDAIAKLKDKEIPGKVAFKLYDTYGFPVDLTADVARERGFSIAMQDFDACMAEQKQRARKAKSFAADYDKKIKLDAKTEFTGYVKHKDTTAITHIIVDSVVADTITTGQKGALVLAKTPFYAESGGQVADIGVIQHNESVFVVNDVQKQGDAVLHFGEMQKGSLKVAQEVSSEIDTSKRRQIMCNHTATHLLHAAMQKILGSHVEQKGSLVNDKLLRFDFSHSKALTPAETRQVETLVNKVIWQNVDVKTIVTSKDEAVKLGAMALFGEKYGSVVRVLKVGEFSVELCGGTHVKQTGGIGSFKIISEASIASGVRRIEAVTGVEALLKFQGLAEQQTALSKKLQAKPADLVIKVDEIQAKAKRLDKQLQGLQKQLSSQAGNDLANKATDCGEFKLLLEQLPDGTNPKSLRDLLDQLKKQLNKAVIVLAIAGKGRVNLIAGVTDNLTDKYKAGDIIKLVAAAVDGKGGGRADMAQAGGSKPENLIAGFTAVKELLAK